MAVAVIAQKNTNAQNILWNRSNTAQKNKIAQNQERPKKLSKKDTSAKNIQGDRPKYGAAKKIGADFRC